MRARRNLRRSALVMMCLLAASTACSGRDADPSAGHSAAAGTGSGELAGTSGTSGAEALATLTTDPATAGANGSGLSLAPTTQSVAKQSLGNVAVVGDSLTVASQQLLKEALTSLGATDVRIDGVEGRRMVGEAAGKIPGIDAVKSIIASGYQPDLWVIELGTNDVGAQVQPAGFRSDMEAILALLPPATPVVWVNLFIGHRAEATDEANRIIGEVVGVRPNAAVADWFTLAADKPDLITDDGVHLERAGEVAYSLVISTTAAKTVVE